MSDGADYDPMQIMRTEDVEALLGVSRWTVWRLVRDGELPKPFRIRPGGNACGWYRRDVVAYLERRGQPVTREYDLADDMPVIEAVASLGYLVPTQPPHPLVEPVIAAFSLGSMYCDVEGWDTFTSNFTDDQREFLRRADAAEALRAIADLIDAEPASKTGEAA